MPILMLLLGGVLVITFLYSPQHIEAGIVGILLLAFSSMGSN